MKRLVDGLVLVLVVCAWLSAGGVAKPPWSAPEIGGTWVRPSSVYPAQPVWGHANGLQVGLWPLPGPRGLIRIYTPYLGHRAGRMINYLAIEPTPVGAERRGLSELETSSLDGVPGLRLWSADDPAEPTPRDPTQPARGIVRHDGDMETLTVYVVVEPFRNGAHVYVRLRFRTDRPYEVAVATYSLPASARLESCTVTATMGNFAQLRTVHLVGGARHAAELWPDFDGDGFAAHVGFPAADLPRSADGSALLLVTPRVGAHDTTEDAPKPPPDWRYYGEPATQVWRDPTPSPALRGCVNGRAVYWGSDVPIPGGVAFENVELVEPFQEGAELWFGVFPGIVEPLSDNTD